MSTPQLGVGFPCRLPPGRLVDVAGRVEAGGFDQLWVVEDCFFAGGVASAATALAVTERITVGVGILPAVARNAAFTAMELAALAGMHPERLVAGLGHGMPAWMAQVGAKPRSPLTALEENLRAVRELLAGDTVTRRGDYVKLDHVRLNHPPRVVPPLLAGVRGPRSLELSGRVSDGTILAAPAAPEYIRQAREHIDEGRRAAGRAGDRHRVVVEVQISVDADPATARDRLRAVLTPGLSDPSAAAHLAPLGLLPEVTALREATASPEEFAARMPDGWIDRLAVAGDPAHCAGRLAALADEGVDAAILVPPVDVLDDQIDALARDVLPRLRDC